MWLGSKLHYEQGTHVLEREPQILDAGGANMVMIPGHQVLRFNKSSKATVSNRLEIEKRQVRRGWIILNQEE